MRLVVLGPGHPYRGGIATTTTGLARGLAARGHAVHFLTPRRQYPGWLFPGAADRDPDACPELSFAKRVLDPLNPWSWRRTAATARRFRADAWILPYWTWAWSGLWWYLLRGSRPPVVGIVHNPADHDASLPQRLAARGVLRACDGLFTHARVLEAELGHSGFNLPLASHPLPFPVTGPLPSAEEARAALEVPVERRVALFLGLIRPYKGVDLLLEAAAGLPADSDWLLLVAGEPWGGLDRALAARAARPDLQGRVRLRLRWVPEPEVRVLLAAADLVVLPYRSGSQSAVAPLALAAGVPVLSTAVGGLPELVRHRVDGVLVEPGSAAALTRALVELDRERLAALTVGALAGRGRLTWDGYGEALEGLIERVVLSIPEPVGR